MYLISPHKQQFKANLHAHSTLSDGRLSPAELKAVYRERGYSILSITDHEAPKDHSELTEEDFLLLTGYEAYIRPHPDCRYDVFASEIHMNLFAREPHNETLICYNPAYCKYLSPAQQEALAKAGSQCTRKYTVDYINDFIHTANENGYLVSYNHPVWSMESEERILCYEGIFSMEMVNFNSRTLNRMEYNGPLYDKLTRNGKQWFVHAADDNHNKFPFDSPQNDSFGAFTMICADELSYDAVIGAMERGDMYASTGPIFKDVSFENGVLHVTCSPVSAVICHIGSKHPASVQVCDGETIGEAHFDISPYARYVRLTLIDENGRTADTRAYSREELGLKPLI